MPDLSEDSEEIARLRDECVEKNIKKRLKTEYDEQLRVREEEWRRIRLEDQKAVGANHEVILQGKEAEYKAAIETQRTDHEAAMKRLRSELETSHEQWEQAEAQHREAVEELQGGCNEALMRMESEHENELLLKANMYEAVCARAIEAIEDRHEATLQDLQASYDGGLASAHDLVWRQFAQEHDGKVDQAEARANEFIAAAERSQAQLHEKEKLLRENNKTISAYANQRNQDTCKVHKLEADLRKATETSERLRQELDLVSMQSTGLEHKVSMVQTDLESDINKLRQRNVEMSGHIESLEEQVEHSNRQVVSLTEERTLLGEEKEFLLADKAAAEAAMEVTRIYYQRELRIVDSVEQDVRDVAAETIFEMQEQAHVQAVESFEHGTKQGEKERIRLNAMIDERDETIDALRHCNSGLQEEVAQLRHDKHQLQGRVNELEDETMQGVGISQLPSSRRSDYDLSPATMAEHWRHDPAVRSYEQPATTAPPPSHAPLSERTASYQIMPTATPSGSGSLHSPSQSLSGFAEMDAVPDVDVSGDMDDVFEEGSSWPVFDETFNEDHSQRDYWEHEASLLNSGMDLDSYETLEDTPSLSVDYEHEEEDIVYGAEDEYFGQEAGDEQMVHESDGAATTQMGESEDADDRDATVPFNFKAYIGEEGDGRVYKSAEELPAEVIKQLNNLIQVEWLGYARDKTRHKAWADDITIEEAMEKVLNGNACAHTKLINQGSSKWTINERQYRACFACANATRPCFKGHDGETILLPLPTKLQTSNDWEQPGF